MSLITFNAIFHTVMGEEIRVLGNHSSLGMWNIGEGLKLTTSKNDFPKWKAVTKIRIERNYTLQFKICVLRGEQLVRWENFPPTENRKYTVDSRSVKITIIENNNEIRINRKYRALSSDQDMAAEILPVRKYNLQDDESEEGSNSSSGAELDDFWAEPPSDTHNIDLLIDTFRHNFGIGIRTNKHSYLKYYNSAVKDPVKKGDQFFIAFYFVPPYVYNQIANTTISNPRIFSLQPPPTTDSSTISKTIEFVVDKVSGPLRTKSSPSIILQSFKYLSILKQLRLKLQDGPQFSIVLLVQNLDQIAGLQNNIMEIANLMHSLLLVDCLVFASYALFDTFLAALEKLCVQTSLKTVGQHQIILIMDIKPAYVRILPNGINLSQSFSEFYQLPIFKIDQPLQNPGVQLIESYERTRHSKMIVFSFGAYEDLDLLLENKAQLEFLSKIHLVYVFTSKALKEYSKIIATFPNIVFISSTYMELSYKGQRRSFIPQSKQHLNKSIKLFPKEFVDTLQSQASRIGVKFQFYNNILLFRQQNSSLVASDMFEEFFKQTQTLSRHYNQTQHQSLIVSQLNHSTIEVRQAYQTKMFLTNLIYITLSNSIGMMILYMINRFQNFKYFRQLKHVLMQQHSLSSVLMRLNQKADFFGYVINNLKSKRADIISEKVLNEQLKQLIECENQMDNQRQQQIKDRKRTKSKKYDFELFKP